MYCHKKNKKYPFPKCHCPIYSVQQVNDEVYILKNNVFYLKKNESHLKKTGEHFHSLYSSPMMSEQEKVQFSEVKGRFPQFESWKPYIKDVILLNARQQPAHVFPHGTRLDFLYRTAETLENLITKGKQYRTSIEQSVRIISEIGKCKHHQRFIIFALYQAGVGFEGAKQHVDYLKVSNEEANSLRLNEIFNQMVGNYQVGVRAPLPNLTAGDGFYLLQKIVQLAALPLGTMTGAKLADVGDIFKASVEGKYFLAGAGWIAMMALFFAGDPPSSVPNYTQNKGINVALLMCCFALAAIFNIPSMQLTEESAKHTFEGLLGNTIFGENASLCSQIAGYSNLALNTILSTTIFSTMITAVSATVLSLPSKTETIIAGLKALVVISLVYATDGYPYVASGIKAMWVKDVESPAGRYALSALLNLPTVMYAVLPTVYGSACRLITDPTRTQFERAFAAFSGICGSALFATLVSEQVEADGWSDTLRLAMTIVTAYVSFEAMARSGADAAHYIYNVPRNMGIFIGRLRNTLTSCTAYFRAAPPAADEEQLIGEQRPLLGCGVRNVGYDGGVPRAIAPPLGANLPHVNLDSGFPLSPNGVDGRSRSGSQGSDVTQWSNSSSISINRGSRA